MNPATAPVMPAIRVLMIEDLATDAELELRELRRAGLRVEACVVADETAFVEAVERFRPQIIISDFSMPNFDGMAALAAARRLAPQVPFIFVSGTIGEEYAIRALKNGAIDYVLKSNLVRLPPAVERALHDASERAARVEAESMFRDVLEHAPDPMIVVNGAGAIVLANGQAERVFGHARQDLVGKPASVLVPGGLEAKYVRHRDGREVPVEITVAPLGARREPLVVASIRDQSERRAQEARIARLSRVRGMLGAINSAIVRIRDRRALFEELCRIAVADGGFAVARVVYRLADGGYGLLATSAPADHRFADMVEDINRNPQGEPSLLAVALREGRAQVSNDVRTDERVPDREALTAHGSFALALLPIALNGCTVGALALRSTATDVFDPEETRLLEEIVSNIVFALELMEKQGRLDYLAYYDALTGLPNQTLFRDRLAQAVEAARRERRQLGLVVFNLERFKGINDALGAPAGDEALKAVAIRLRDFLGDDNRISRLSGDTYAAIFPGVESPADLARSVTDAGDKLFGTPYVLAGREIRVGAKAGIAIFPGDGVDAEALLRNAEAALAKARDTGERYLYYAPQINARVAEQVDLEQRLRRAVADGELQLHFQPKVDLQTRRIVGVEALMRWNGPDGKPIPPVRFVPLLEDTGLIYEAGRHALATAAATHRAWMKAGLDAPRIAVNVSALQLGRPGFVNELVEAIGDVKTAGIDLEVTESLMMEDVVASIAKLRDARDLGVHIALDDFGTGYSSLAYLARLPLDTLKVDRSFIKGITENTNDVSLVTTMISLAQALRFKVVAEGVETEEQARLLRLLRCDQMQGWLFSPAVTREKLEDLLRAQGS
jgi:diguanylate cyclase (GGDEF)-like protein